MLDEIAVLAPAPLASERLIARAIPSPFGPLRLVASGRGLVAVLWPNDRPSRVALGPVENGASAVLETAERELDAYLAGHIRHFTVPLDPRGTPFQILVWAALAAIPFGETSSYRTVAATIGRPTAMRAVGAAIGRNPLSIVVPCHRVVGSSGALTGFAGGLGAKRRLLALEGHGGLL